MKAYGEIRNGKAGCTCLDCEGGGRKDISGFRGNTAQRMLAKKEIEKEMFDMQEVTSK